MHRWITIFPVRMTRNWKSKYSIYRVLPSGQTRKFQVLVASFKAHFRRGTAGRKRIHLFTSRKLGRLLGNSTFFGGLFTWNHCESNQQSMDDNGCTDPSLHLLIQVSVKFTNNRYPLQKRFATSKITPFVDDIPIKNCDFLLLYYLRLYQLGLGILDAIYHNPKCIWVHCEKCK